MNGRFFPAGFAYAKALQKVRAIFVVGVIAAVLFLSAGCSSGLTPDRFQQQVQRFLTQTRLAREASSPPISPENQVLVVGADGNLFLIDAISGQRFALTVDASPQRRYLQPAWSPDGERIAWTRLEGGDSAVEVSRFDGSERRSVATSFPPFYFFWSPAGNHLAFLSNWAAMNRPTIALRLVELREETLDVRTLAEGRPLYFSWSPDGKALLTHIDGERIELLKLNGEVEPLEITAAQFSAPQWAADGERLIYAVADGRQRLIVADRAGRELVELTDYTGRIAFSLSPDGAQMAYVVTNDALRWSVFGPLYVVDVETLRTREVTDDPVLAFYWSPDGRRLAYLTLEFVDGRLGLRWHVWEGRRVARYAFFLPFSIFVENYLPFFDQYAQSHRIWSPAGDAFVFAGALQDGRSGVWVQDVIAGGEPRLLGPGVIASYSPR
ncbi:MAG: hypothetical protein NZ553_01770 [Caldilinea sp.]|nr:hypothetical protein [Caldilinea sp.]MDW8439178.1 hypothetical protein [Caldilineaceae bacterium]